MKIPKRALSLTLTALTATLLSACGSHPATPPTASAPPSPQVQDRPVDPLTGLPSPVHGPLIGVMVENSEYGRPQYGLSSADVVYEAYTEFFYYSRYLLLFWGHAPAMVGPDRSARPYFVSLIHEWPAAYVHAGASNPGYQSIQQDGIHNLDLDANAFNLGFRVASRPAPHNLFTNIQTDMKEARRLWGNPTVAPHWPFVSQVSSGTPPYQTVTLVWNPNNTIEQWRWDGAAQGWTRWVRCPNCPDSQWTQVMGMNSGKPVIASNVVIEYTNESYLPDPAGTGWIQIATHGQGPALLFLGHRFYRGTWENAGSGQPTRFYLPDGQPARFNPGQTWIEIVPNRQAPTQNFQLTLN
ncbi:hypothetical protein TPY_1271 [Sulfobacillus acidophilus TPY]|uniref:DUF3048 domain-containing protein n=1 Tax=Sulfobacillus acidophilus (strain ATCC 700253 / DSM 10332 / NAL) TaxID=679936 RepID=G8TVC5_SULAD|nr:hypothetical protein TPY_1271 [Sulfobacillus acidophilus TPY]AEW05844.1 hypothetical protein Sulac_2381 [Sulfobacillus acidophilus DSM 10332]